MSDTATIERRPGRSRDVPVSPDAADRAPATETGQSYPFHAASYYPKEQWYVAAYASELADGKPLGRRIFGEEVVLFRDESGEAVGVAGVCVHRYMPLAGGQVVGSRLVCPYHGYAFAGDGRCVHIPTGGTLSPHARLRRYPVVEDGPFVWIWPGTAERAAQAPPPDLSDIGLSGDGEGWRVDIAARLDLAARAPLLVDNLFDLSHIAFIHLQSLPGGGVGAAAGGVRGGQRTLSRQARHRGLRRAEGHRGRADDARDRRSPGLRQPAHRPLLPGAHQLVRPMVLRARRRRRGRADRRAELRPHRHAGIRHLDPLFRGRVAGLSARRRRPVRNAGGADRLRAQRGRRVARPDRKGRGRERCEARDIDRDRRGRPEGPASPSPPDRCREG